MRQEATSSSSDPNPQNPAELCNRKPLTHFLSFPSSTSHPDLPRGTQTSHAFHCSLFSTLWRVLGREREKHLQKEASSQAGFRESPCPQPGPGIKETAEDKEGFKALEQGGRKGLRKFTKQSVREGMKREPCWVEGPGHPAHLTLRPVRNL